MPRTSTDAVVHRGDITRRRMITATAVAGITLGVAVILPDGTRASAVTSPSPLRFLRNANSGDPTASGTDRWQFQVLQGDRERPPSSSVQEQLVYATAVRRTSDPAGVTQCLPPADVPSSWLLTDRAGQLITRNQGDDTAIDVGNPSFQLASADFLIAKCRAAGTGQPWTGVHHDEVNAGFGWGWAGAVPRRYPTDDAWQSTLAGYMSYLAQRLGDAGFTLVGNLGSVIAENDDDWYRSLVGNGVVPSLEYFVCGEAVPNGSTANYASPDEWERQLRFVESAETNRAGSPPAVTRAGTRIVVHDRQDSEAGIRYSLCSYLLAYASAGTSVFGADVEYHAATTPYPTCYTDALGLGAPTGSRTRVAKDLWGRSFAHGHVLVNVGTSAVSCWGTTLGPRSATIGTTSRPRPT